MNTIQKLLFGLAGLAVLLFAVHSFVPKKALGNTSESIPAFLATTSVATVNTTAITVFATSSCAARIISTSASPIMITFSDNQGAVPTGTFGFLQPASTTVSYTNTAYGCGAYKVYSFVSGPITVSESR